MWIIDGWWWRRGGCVCVAACCIKDVLVFLSSVCFKVDLCGRALKSGALVGVTHVLKLLSDKICSSRLQPEVATWGNLAVVVSSAKCFIRRQSRWRSGKKHQPIFIVEVLCPKAVEPNSLFYHHLFFLSAGSSVAEMSVCSVSKKINIRLSITWTWQLLIVFHVL